MFSFLILKLPTIQYIRVLETKGCHLRPEKGHYLLKVGCGRAAGEGSTSCEWRKHKTFLKLHEKYMGGGNESDSGQSLGRKATITWGCELNRGRYVSLSGEPICHRTTSHVQTGHLHFQPLMDTFLLCFK